MKLIPYGKHHIDAEDIESVVKVFESDFLTQGPLTEVFEQAITEYTGARYAVAVSSGTAALHIAAMAAGVALGNTLVTSPITFVASANAGVYAGGNVLFADIDENTINMSPAALASVVANNANIQAIVPVHFAGLPCDMPAIHKEAGKAGAVIIEDAAHALGACYPDGGRVGNCQHSLMTIFSFHPVKAIAAGEGGMITTNDERIYRKLIRLRSHGINKLDDPFELPEQGMTNGIKDPWYYEMQELGFNYRITDIQCALAISQMKKLDRFIERRRQLVRQYDEYFADFDNCRPIQRQGRDSSAHHLYVLRIDFQGKGINRAQVIQNLRDKGIASQVHYIAVPAQPYYQRLGFSPNDYPAARHYYEQALTIPLFYDLTDEQQRYIVDAFRELIG
jgi:perosamine synthetase